MDKSVRRVTLVQRDGDTRRSTVLYENNEEEDELDVRYPSLERAVRHLLKAELILSQEAYQRHLKSTSRRKSSWLLDEPSNILHAIDKAGREAAKAVSLRVGDEDEDEDENE
jgi:hypothetical protein